MNEHQTGLLYIVEKFIDRELPFHKAILMEPKLFFKEMWDSRIIKMTTWVGFILIVVTIFRILQVGWSLTWITTIKNIEASPLGIKFIWALMILYVIGTIIRDLYFGINIFRYKVALKLILEIDGNEE
jgi:hypothetical protein